MQEKQRITDCHISLMKSISKEYLSRFEELTSESRIDKSSFELGIKWLYTEVLDLPMPEVVYCESWIQCLRDIHNERLSLGKTILSFEEDRKEFQADYCSYIGLHCFGGTSFYDFFNRTGNMPKEGFNNYRDLVLSGAFLAYTYNTKVFAIQPPTKVDYRVINKQHKCPLIQFSDGSVVDMENLFSKI